MQLVLNKDLLLLGDNCSNQVLDVVQAVAEGKAR